MAGVRVRARSCARSESAPGRLDPGKVNMIPARPEGWLEVNTTQLSVNSSWMPKLKFNPKLMNVLFPKTSEPESCDKIPVDSKFLNNP